MGQAWSQLPQPALIAVFAIFGLAIGSFLNVVIHRLPRIMERQWWSDAGHQIGDGDSFRRVFAGDAPVVLGQAGSEVEKRMDALPDYGIAKPRSACPSCQRPIRWSENLPVLSWLALRGRCAGCKAPIAARYPLVELLTAVLFAAAAWRFGAQPVALLWAGFLAVLVAAAFIDWDTTLLPDSLTMPLLWAGLVASAAGWTLPLPDAIWGAVAGYLSLWSVYWLFKLTTGKEGMGYGDFKLLGALGAWLGWQAILPIVLMASVIGAVVGITLKVSGGLREGRYVPFGPFLAGAGIVVLLVGSDTLLAAMGWR
jgi:leader peptidase (prepilin peptidase) / N-methyltransferase